MTPLGLVIIARAAWHDWRDRFYQRRVPILRREQFERERADLQRTLRLRIPGAEATTRKGAS